MKDDDSEGTFATEKCRSFLTTHEAYDVSRRNSLPSEPSLCGKIGIEFMSYPIPDRGCPNQFLRHLNLLKVWLVILFNGRLVLRKSSSL